MKTTVKMVAAMALSVSLFGCAMKQVVRTGGDQPSWARMSSGLNNGPYGKGFYGVGVWMNSPTEGAGRDGADSLASQNLAKMISKELSALSEVYRGNISNGTGDSRIAASLEQLSQVGGGDFVHMTLTGITIPDHWYNKEDKVEYALAFMSLESMKQSLETVRQLSEESQQIIRKHSDEFMNKLNSRVAESAKSQEQRQPQQQ